MIEAGWAMEEHKVARKWRRAHYLNDSGHPICGAPRFQRSNMIFGVLAQGRSSVIEAGTNWRTACQLCANRRLEGLYRRGDSVTVGHGKMSYTVAEPVDSESCVLISGGSGRRRIERFDNLRFWQGKVPTA